MTLVLLLSAASVAQAPNGNSKPASEKQILKNSKVEVSRVEVAAGESLPQNGRGHDSVTVFVTTPQARHKLLGKTVPGFGGGVEEGDVWFHSAGAADAGEHKDKGPLSAVVVEFVDAQGKTKNVGKKSQTCVPDKQACIEEKELFCTEKVCVEDVTMAPGAMSMRHSHATDHMLVAISDYQLTDEVEGRGTVVRTKQAGEVEYIPAGITHQLKNTGQAPARFAVIVWR